MQKQNYPFLPFSLLSFEVIFMYHEKEKDSQALGLSIISIIPLSNFNVTLS